VLPGRAIEGLDSLVALATEASNKAVEDFEADGGLEARLAPGRQPRCGEAVLAVDLDGPYVLASGSATTMTALIRHLR
jgi:hypothetical protein